MTEESDARLTACLVVTIEVVVFVLIVWWGVTPRRSPKEPTK